MKTDYVQLNPLLLVSLKVSGPKTEEEVKELVHAAWLQGYAEGSLAMVKALNKGDDRAG